MKFTSIDEKVKELIEENVQDNLADHLADVHKLIDDKLEELNAKIHNEIDEYVNTNKFKGYLAGIVAAEVTEYFKKLPSDYAITLLCSALTRLVK